MAGPALIIPVLGVVGRFILSRGVRKATQKYGQKKVKDAQKQIAKREAAINKKAKEARFEQSGSKYDTSSRSRAAETMKQKTRESKTPKKDPEYYLEEYPEGKALKFSKGGLVKYKNISKMK